MTPSLMLAQHDYHSNIATQSISTVLNIKKQGNAKTLSQYI